ncbi:MAG: hypothetical protein JNL55_08605 [Steroidobacter sp.]|nr:hypothetical protein [Steroidobacter sp.]
MTLLLTGCRSSTPDDPRFSLSGSISGLTVSGLVLANGGDTLNVASAATQFTFPRSVRSGDAYAVSVQSAPAGLSCSVANGSGTMGSANVTNIAVTCVNRNFTLGGSVSGLASSGLTLAYGSELLAVPANATSFVFTTPAAFASAYAVTVATQPPRTSCNVSSGTGTMPAANVTDVAVTCSVVAFTLGGDISGLSADGLVLANGSDRLSVAANAATFSMLTDLAAASAYNITVAAQPAGMNCSVTDGSGTIAAADVSNAQVTCAARQWAWVKGPSTVGGSGTYGTKGVASPGNVPPPRNSAHTWIDAAGDLWLFGGAAFVAGEGDLSDLWKYDHTTQQWTWMHGSNTTNGAGNYGTQLVAASSNEPRARHEGVTWIDSNGKLWLFGGYSDAPGIFGSLNDLWRYDPTTNEWTWIAGSSTANITSNFGALGVAAPGNMPGARLGAVSWLDSTGRFWMFGGFAHPANTYFNDMWSYDPVTGWWTWEGGSDSVNVAGSYGTRGVAATANAPGGRVNATGATNGVNELLLFAGAGFDSTGANGAMNDLWSWDLTTHQWTWLSGSNTNSVAGVYGSQGLSAASNAPGARYSSISWVDSDGRYWMFGGHGANDSGAFSDMNDLWQYDPATHQWTWVNGSASGNAQGVYGTVNVPAPNNSPGGRLLPSGWIDASNRLWLFGGYGWDGHGARYKLSDLWMY